MPATYGGGEGGGDGEGDGCGTTCHPTAAKQLHTYVRTSEAHALARMPSLIFFPALAPFESPCLNITAVYGRSLFYFPNYVLTLLLWTFLRKPAVFARIA